MENSEHNKSDKSCLEFISDENYKEYKRNVDDVNIFYDKLLVGLLIKIFV